MVECTIPYEKKSEIETLLRFQKRTVNKLLHCGQLLHYACSTDEGKLWIIVQAQNELDALDVIAELPLSYFLKLNINKVSFHHSIPVIEGTEFSLN